MTGAAPKGGRAPAQPPVAIPVNLRHGTSYVYRYYRCRCRRCQSWRRTYDRARYRAQNPVPRRRYAGRLQRGGWYVCLVWGEARGHHLYEVGRCVRCGADQATEDYWERKWQDS